METFSRQPWTGWIRSSEGYSIRIVGRNDLQYLDDAGQLSMFVEPLANYSDIVLDMSTVHDASELSRFELIDRFRRAFKFAGWRLIESSSTEPDDS